VLHVHRVNRSRCPRARTARIEADTANASRHPGRRYAPTG
jgi:hypothetical protein